MSEEKLSFKRRLYRKTCYLFGKYMPDKLYIQMLYEVRLGEKCNLKDPKTFDEKLNWLKLYDRNPKYTELVDKYAVREYIKDKIGEEYLIPVLGVWDDPEKIDFSALPDEFVLKCTHDSASVIICKNKKELNIEEAKSKLKKSMGINYFYPCREWPYRDVRPRIVAEKYMVDESGSELKDYKIYCADGTPYLIQVDFGRFTKHERNLYDTDWNYIDKQIEYPKNPGHQIRKPESLDKMLELAAVLSKGIASVRTDFYDINGKVYFGEITFYQEGGFARFEPKEYARELGDMIKLPIQD